MLDVKKAKYSFFSETQTIFHFQLPNLLINNLKIKQQEHKIFLEFLRHENLTWKEHLKYIENKFAKNIDFSYKAKSYLNKNCLLSIYYSYVHASISYANIAWASLNFAHMRRFHSEQKHIIHIICKKDRFGQTNLFQTE